MELRQDHIVIIDPGTKSPEFGSFNKMQLMSPLKCTYHVPSIFSEASLTHEDISFVKGVVVMGSSASVTDPLQWRLYAEEFIKKCIDRKIPILGLCWGHQWIATLMGGKVEKIKGITKPYKGLRDVELQEQGIFKKSKGQLVVSHQDWVSRKPSNAQVLVKSDVLDHEGFKYKDLPVYTFQQHPEATLHFCENNRLGISNHTDLVYGQGLVAKFLKSTLAAV